MKISAIIIARNEEQDLLKCLESVSWVDEIVVVDNDSTDRTGYVARKFGAKVFEYKEEANTGSFAKLREFAASKATGEWILYIDADERVTKELQEEILSVISNQSSVISAFALPRKNNLLGRDMKYGGWWPDYVLRLIRKDKLKGYEGELHEQPKIEGAVGKLKNPLYHITHTSLTEMIDKTNRWSEIEAKLLFDAKHPPMNIWRFGTAAFREFWYRGVRKLGFLDGTVGIIEIMYQVYSRLITYSKLWEMQLKKTNK